MKSLINKIKSKRFNLSAKFIIGCSLTLIIALGISFYVIAHHQERLIMGQIENEARAIFEQIVITRRWIADHGGVFVEKLPWVKPNPYLSAVGAEVEITDTKGRKFVKKNPAMVTREISKYSKDKDLYWFHITSLKLVNPENAPDEFEKAAMIEFEKNGLGLKELTSIDTIEKSNFLRYISPLYIEEACLECHAHQGYKIGDMRGAISVTIPMDKTFAKILENRRNMLIAAVFIVLSLIAAMFLMMKRLVLTPMKRLKTSIKEFPEGSYSPSKRLKTGDEFEDLCAAFSKMAFTLTEYHNCLHNKVQAATMDLEETNRKLIKANKLLNETNVRKSDFIARASHELRTPLTSIRGSMDYISAKLSSFPQHETSLDDLHIFFEVIKKNSDRLIRMVNDMLDIERIETGISELHLSSTDLSYLIAETVANSQLNADEKGISIEVNIPDSIYILADEDRIKQVIINLLINAIKFTPAGSKIDIFAYHEKGFVITEIWDKGHGIQPHEQGKIFDKFYKNSNKEGTGLGLAISKSIVGAHNGIIGVKSDGRNGSCFYFKLPQADSHDASGALPAKDIPQRKLLEITKKISAPC